MNLFFSDVHLDDGVQGDFTLYDKGRFGRFINYAKSLLVKPDDHAYSLGDLIDGWRWTEKEIIGAHYTLLCELSQWDKLIALAGNHDPRKMLAEFFSGRVYDELNVGGRTILHGDRYDTFLDTEIERDAVAAMCRVLTLWRNPVVNRIVARIQQGHRDNGPIKNKLQAKRPGEEFICGHTHTATIDGWYANDGSVCNETMTYIVMHDNGVLELKEWK